MASGKGFPGDVVKVAEKLRSSWPVQILLILVTGTLCYLPSFRVPFVFDDFDLIVFNKEVAAGKPLLDVLLHGTARRIADATFAINYRLGGQEPFGYHLGNLLIHLGVALLVFLLCHTVVSCLRQNDPSGSPAADVQRYVSSPLLPLAVSLLFVCHPLQTQAVTYLVQRHTSLATFFYLATMLLYLKGRLVILQQTNWRTVAAWWLAAGTTALLACLTKQIAYSLPLMMLMSEAVLFRGRLLRYYLIPVFLSAGVLLAIMLLPLVQGGHVSDVLFNLRHATAETIYLPRSSYLYTQARVVATYLRLLLLPVGQTLDYDYRLSVSIAEPAVLAATALHGCLLMLAGVLAVKAGRSRENGLPLRMIAFGIAWFYVGLLIESSLIPITDVIMEHRVYLPAAGFFMAVVAAADYYGQRLTVIGRIQWLLFPLLILVLTSATVMRNRLWGDDVAFWEDAARKAPRKGRVLGNLATAYLNAGRYEEGLRADVAALRLAPGLERAWNRLGTLMEGIPALHGRFSSGKEFLTAQEHTDLRWLREHNSVIFNNMGVACEYLGSLQEAADWYWKAVQMNDNSELAWFNFGLLAKKNGNAAGLAKARERLNQLNPLRAAQLAL